MKIGIFGGTFNPPHNTHVNIARQAIEQLGLDRLLVVPCGDPPHKKCDVDKRARLEMTKLAFGKFAEVWRYEIDKQAKSYTVETLREVKRLYSDAELYLIIGGDSLRDFEKWYKPEEIVKLATLAVADRGKHDYVAFSTAERYCGADVVCLDVNPNVVSSTEIRLRYQFGYDNGDYVPKSVNEYIKNNGLYAEYRDMALKVRQHLTPERYSHTFYVVKRGLELAKDGEKDKAFVACLLHDVAKYIKPCDYAKYGFMPDCDMPPSVVHSFLGAQVARRDFGITDEEILNAIAYHTTGRPNMTRLEKLVYVADKTEETRSYPIKHLLKGTFEENFIACLEEAYGWCVERHSDSVYPLSEQTLAFYCPKKGGKA